MYHIYSLLLNIKDLKTNINFQYQNKNEIQIKHFKMKGKVIPTGKSLEDIKKLIKFVFDIINAHLRKLKNFIVLKIMYQSNIYIFF